MPTLVLLAFAAAFGPIAVAAVPLGGEPETLEPRYNPLRLGTRPVPAEESAMISIRRVRFALPALAACAVAVFAAGASGQQGDAVSARAKELQARAIVIDTHDDTTQRLLYDKTFDIAQAQPERQHRHPAHARGRARRALLLDLGAEPTSPARRRSSARST